MSYSKKAKALATSIIHWSGVAFFALVGMMGAISKSPLAILGALFVVVLLAPPLSKKIPNQYQKHLTVKNKLIVSSVMFFVCFFAMISADVSSQNKANIEEALQLSDQAVELIAANDIEAAQDLINQSASLYSESENPAVSLQTEVQNYESSTYLEDTLASLSEEDYLLLLSGELNGSFLNNEHLNTLFIQKLEENSERRDEIIETREQAKKEEEERKAEEERIEKIETQFSAWDGSHRELTSLIKDSMNDPSSYEHVETVYWDMDDHLIVSTTFRGNNAFGALVMNTIKAKVSVDGYVIEIIEQ